MPTAERIRISGWPRELLRWLTSSALRSMASFVILTFVPILLLTYYIVATSIRNTKADSAATDRQVRDFAVSLLRTNFRGEREALNGEADEMALMRALGVAGATTRRANLDRTQAVSNLSRLLRRRPEFSYIALYNAAGALQAAAGQPAPPVIAGAESSPPVWFVAALHGQSSTAQLQLASSSAPGLVGLAEPVSAGEVPGGVLLGALPNAVVGDWMRHIGAGSDRFLYLVGALGVIQANSDAPFSNAQIASLPAAAEALGGHTGSGEFVAAVHLENNVVTYTPLPEENMALLVVRPVRFGFYLYRVFYDKLALIAVIVFLLAAASGLLLRAAFRYYLQFTREVESGRAKTEALLGSIGDGVFAVDAEGRIIEFNRAAAQLAGRGAGEALGRAYTEVVRLAGEHEAPGSAAFDPVRQAMQEGRNLRYSRNVVLVRSGGARLPVTISAAPVRDEQGGVNGCVVVFNDASQEHEVDRMKNEFISIASHQLRTPMSGVKGALALLLEDVLGPLNPEQRLYLRRAYESNERLIALVNDLLNVSRLEQGSLQLHHEPVHLEQMLPALAAEFQPRAARYRQRLQIAIAAGQEPVVEGDAMRLREVFANLLDNAVKYTPEGGEIWLRLHPGSDAVVVEVSDSGVGIPADKLGSLFQKFGRVQNPLSGREFGSGLGLYFARSVVVLHGGAIEVASEPGKGSTFRVVLPRRTLSGATAVAEVLPAARRP